MLKTAAFPPQFQHQNDPKKVHSYLFVCFALILIGGMETEQTAYVA